MPAIEVNRETLEHQFRLLVMQNGPHIGPPLAYSSWDGYFERSGNWNRVGNLKDSIIDWILDDLNEDQDTLVPDADDLTSDEENMAKPSPAKVWGCKIGAIPGELLPDWADRDMREAVRIAYWTLTGQSPDFIFSGWGATLNEAGQEVLDEDSRPDADNVTTLEPDDLLRDKTEAEVIAESFARLERQNERLLELLEAPVQEPPTSIYFDEDAKFQTWDIHHNLPETSNIITTLEPGAEVVPTHVKTWTIASVDEDGKEKKVTMTVEDGWR